MKINKWIVCVVMTVMVSISSPVFCDELPVFPGWHADGSVSDRWTWSSDGNIFDVYFWRWDNHLWVEALPVSGDPFLCSGSFSIIQDGISYNDTVRLLNQTGNTYCSYLTGPIVLLVTQFGEQVADISDAMVIAFDGGASIYELSIPAATDASDPDIEDEDDDPWWQIWNGCFIETIGIW